MAEELKVELRAERGKRRSRRMRHAGRVPAILYGHGEEPVSLAVPTEQIKAAIRHSSQMVDLTGALTESALIKDLQWDTLGTDVLHIDLMRVDASEVLTVEVTVDLRGEAPGTKEGGIVTHINHSVEIEVPASDVPERLHININQLGLEQSLTAADIEDMPQKAKLVTPPETVIVSCTAPLEEPEEEELAGEAEPEVIGQKESEEEAGE